MFRFYLNFVGILCVVVSVLYRHSVSAFSCFRVSVSENSSAVHRSRFGVHPSEYISIREREI